MCFKLLHARFNGTVREWYGGKNSGEGVKRIFISTNSLLAMEVLHYRRQRFKYFIAIQISFHPKQVKLDDISNLRTSPQRIRQLPPTDYSSALITQQRLRIIESPAAPLRPYTYVRATVLAMASYIRHFDDGSHLRATSNGRPELRATVNFRRRKRRLHTKTRRRRVTAMGCFADARPRRAFADYRAVVARFEYRKGRWRHVVTWQRGLVARLPLTYVCTALHLLDVLLYICPRLDLDRWTGKNIVQTKVALLACRWCHFKSPRKAIILNQYFFMVGWNVGSTPSWVTTHKTQAGSSPGIRKILKKYES